MQGKPLFDRKKRLSLIEKGVSLILLKSLPKPLRRRGCIPQKLFFNSKKQLSLFPLTILSHPTNSIHAPLHSERGRGRGCRWLGERLFFRPYLPIQKCLKIFPNTSFGVICPPVISASSSRQMRRSSLIRSPERIIERASITRRIDSSARVSAS